MDQPAQGDPAVDHNDFIWDRIAEIPLPPAPSGETALDALRRRVEWSRLIWTDRAIPNRFRVLAAWDDMSPEQKAELEGVNIFDLRMPWKKVNPAYFDELPDGKLHGVVPRPRLIRSGPQPVAQPTYRKLTA
jgi:hypothetical protein